MPIASDAYFAFSSIHCVNKREITPITKNIARKPIEIPELTTSARRIRSLAVNSVSSRTPRKKIRYVGNNTNPHGFTAANTPKINE